MQLIFDDRHDAANAGAQGSASNPVGPEQGVIEEARRRQHRRRVRASAGGLFALVLLALLWAWLGGGGPARSHGGGSTRGADPREAVHIATTDHASIAVQIGPDMIGGSLGWCVSAGGGASCGGIVSPDEPLYDSGTSFSDNQPYTVMVAIVMPNVSAVLVGGRRRVSTVAVPGLPYGLRAVRVLIANKPSSRRPGKYTPPRHEPKLVALAANGARLEDHPASVAGPGSLAWQLPEQEPHGACSLTASGIRGLSAQWGHLAERIPSYSAAAVGGAFLSCIDTEYYLRGAGAKVAFDAAILLSAAHPKAMAPAIPDMKPIAGASGFYEAPGTTRGPLTVTRRGDAWLVVTGGKGRAQRIELLRHLHATIHG